MNIDNKVKELETFLGNKTVLQGIFGTDDPTLKRAFGNPWDFNETELQEQRMGYVQTEKKPIEKPDTPKPYRPRKSTISSLREASISIQKQLNLHLRTVSPFPIHNDTTEHMHYKMYSLRGTGRKVLESLLSFSSQQLCAMEQSTKEEVIEALLHSIKQSLRKHRSSFFHKGFMFEGDFEENKLKYLLENGDEPIIISEDDYDFLEEQYMTAMNKLIHRMFEEAYSSGRAGKLNFTEVDGDEFFEFMHTCAKRFSYLNRRVFSSLSLHYKFDSLYVIDEKDIDLSSYHALQCCPITEYLKSLKIINEGNSWLYDLNEVTSIEPSRLFKLLTKENYLYIMNETMSYLKLSLRHDINSFESFNENFIASLSKKIYKEDTPKFYERLFYHFEYYMKMQKQQTN